MASGLRPPTKIGKPSGIPKAGGGSNAPSVTSGVAASSSGTSFSIGDRVLVSGGKVGRIEFLGPTQFAPGDWAGVILDKEEGKNDGSVAGVRYFQCEPLHGIFSRPAKLEKFSENKRSIKSPTSSRLPSAATPKLKSVPLTAASLKSREGNKDSKPKTGMRSPASSIRSLKYGTPSRPTTASTVKQDFEVGDKVIVNGVKIGFARYIGETEFAKGNWVGVELDTAQGKNDGSVMGKRYFACEMLYGLFAPIHKVKKHAVGTPRTMAGKAAVRETASSIARKKAIASTAGIKSPGSSVASVSTTSSFAAAKAKNLSSEVSSRYQRKTTPAGTSALQEALKEKQQHVESLMVERDLERAEMMQATQDAALVKKEMDEVNSRYHKLAAEKEAQLDDLKNLIEQADIEKVNLRQQLEEQKTKVEDLQFRLEEEVINRDDMQSELKKAHDKVRELDTSVNIERNRAQILQTDLENTRTSGIDDKSALDSLIREKEAANAAVFELQTKLKLTEEALQTQAKSGDDMDVFEDRISELMQDLEKERMKSEHHQQSEDNFKMKLEEIESEKETLRQVIAELKSEKERLCEERDSLQFSVDELKLGMEENEKALETANNQVAQLRNEKNDLEQEKTDILKGNGDSSQQLIILNDHLREKDRIIEQLHSDIKTYKDFVNDIKNKNEALETTIKDSKLKLEESQNKAIKLENDLHSAQENVGILSSKLEASLSAGNVSATQIKDIESERDLMKKRVEEIMRNSKTLQETLHGVQKSKDEREGELSQQLTDSKSTLEDLQKRLDEQVSENSYLTKKTESMQNKVIELSEHLEHLNKTHDETKSTLSQIQEQSGEETKNLLKQLQEHRDTSEKQRSMVSETTRHLNEMLQQKNVLEEERDSLVASLKTLEEEKKIVQASFESVSTEKDGLLEELTNVKSEIESLKTRCSTAESCLEKAEVEISDKSQRIEDLSSVSEETNLKVQNCERKLAEEMQIKSNIQSEIEKLRSEKAEVDATLIVANEGIELSKQKIEELKSTLDEVRQNHGFVELALQNSESENKSLAKQLEESQDEVKRKDENAFKLLDEIQNLKEYHEKLKVDLEMQKEKCAENEKSRDEFMAGKESADAKCSKLEDELHASVKNCEEKDTAIAELSSKVEAVVSNLDAKNAEFNTVVASRDESVTAVKEISTKLRDVETEKATLQHKLDSLSEQHGSTEQKSFELLDKIQELEKLNGQLKADLETKDTKISAIFEDLQKMIRTKDSLIEEKDLLEANVASLKSERDSFGQTIDKNKLEIEKMSGDIVKFNDELKSLQEVVDNKTKDALERTSKITSQESEISSLKAKLELTSSTNTEGRQKITELLDQIKVLEEDKNRLEAETKASHEKLNEVKESLANTSVSLNAAEKQLNESKTQSDAHLKNVNELQSSLTKIQSMNALLNSEIENTRTISKEKENANLELVTMLQAQLEELARNNQELHKALKDKNLDFTKLTAECDKLKTVFEEASKAKSASESELQAIVSKLNWQLETAKSAKQASDEKLEELSNRLDGTLKSLESVKASEQSLKEDLEKYKSETTALLDGKSAIESKLFAMSNEKDELSKTLNEKIQSVKEELTSKNQQICQFQARIDQLVLQCTSEQKKLEHLQKSHEETHSDLNHKSDALSQELSALKMVLEATEADKSSLESRLETITAEKEALRSDLTHVQSEKSELSNKINALSQTQHNEATTSAATIENLSGQINTMKTQYEKSVHNLKVDYDGQMVAMKEAKLQEYTELENKMSEKLTSLESEVKMLQVERDSLLVKTEQLQTSNSASSEMGEKLKSLMQEKAKLLEERDAKEREVGKLKERTIENEEMDKQHRSKILILETDVTNHKERYQMLEEQHKSLCDIHEKVQVKLHKMEKSAPDIEERESVLKREFANERDSLQQTIDITTALVEDTRKQSESFQKEISFLKGEAELVESLRESLRIIEKEKESLAIELRNLKMLPIAQSGPTVDSGVSSDEELQGQVNFLNSVIVDQQAKIAELNEKIDELEQMLLNGEDVDPAAFAEEYEKENSGQHRAAPRLFCDICDIFDAHDTDDCPTQSSLHYDMEGLPPAVHNATKRGEDRSYCENCEVFGHDTADCEEDDDMY